MSEPKSRRKDRQLERRRQAWQLRIQGLSQCEIARRLGVDQSTISLDLKLAFPEYREQTDAAREEFVKWHMARTEYYLDCLDKKIKDGDEKAVQTALKVLEHEARLQGLGVVIPGQVAVNVTNTNDPDEIRRRLKEALDQRKEEK